MVEEEETVAALAMNPLSDDTPDVTEQSEPQQSIRSSNRLAKRSLEEEAAASSALVTKRPRRAATIKTCTMLIGTSHIELHEMEREEEETPLERCRSDRAASTEGGKLWRTEATASPAAAASKASYSVRAEKLVGERRGDCHWVVIW